MRKRFYIFFVARDEAGQLRKISIPVQYAYALVAGLVIGAFCLTGIVGSYTRMLAKVSHYNQLRTDHAQLKKEKVFIKVGMLYLNDHHKVG